MLSALLSGLLVGQVIPESASLLYPGIPETPTEVPVNLVTHSATYRLGVQGVVFQSLSTLRNSSNVAVTFTLELPVRGDQVRWNQSQGLRLSAEWGKRPLVLATREIKRQAPTDAQKKSGIWARRFERVSFASVTLMPRETKSLAVRMVAPIGIAGLDGAQRMVAYDTSGADTWLGATGQFHFSIQDPKRLVLQTFAALPEGKWKIGERGAFWTAENFTPARRPHLIYTYYPSTFERIGGGR